MKKILSLLLAVCLLVPCLTIAPVRAAEDEEAAESNEAGLSYEKELKKFPKSYQTKLKQLHKQHPNWIFVAEKNGLDFYEVVAAECEYNRSVVDGTASDILKSKAEGDYDKKKKEYTYRDSNYWVNASPSTVAFFLDPRNHLSEKFIWQFEAIDYNKNQTEDVVETALYGTFMSKERSPKIKYYTKKGKKKTLTLKDSKGKKYYPTYAKLITLAGKKSGVSPIYLATKIRLEVGNQSGSVTGTYTSDTGARYNGVSLDGIYDYYNIYASDSEDPILNGLAWAAGYPNAKGKPTETTYGRPWTDPAKSIINGAKFIYDYYLLNGQHTGYYIKFNVTPQAAETWTLYLHQYMTCIYGATTEAAQNYSKYLEAGIVDLPYIFYIPVFENMPGEEEIQIKGAAEKAKVTAETTMTSSPGIYGGYITSIPKGATVTVLSGTADNTGWTDMWNWIYDPYWFKVKYKGKTGYISVEKLKFNVSRTMAVGGKYDLTLKSGLDKVWYDSSDPAIVTVSSTGKLKAVKKGTATIYAISSSGIAAYRVEVKGKVKKITASSVKVGKIKEQKYTGEQIKPSVTVKDGKTTLKKGKHYTLTYKDNEWPGTATVTIKGVGTYTGSRKVTFKIKGTYKEYITKEQVSYYKGPGLSYKEIGTVKKGKTVKVLTGGSKKTADGLTFLPVRIDGNFYYMASKYLKKK